MRIHCNEVSIRALAIRFSQVVRDWATPLELKLIREVNRQHPQYCETHEYFDANMAMHEAWVSLFGRDRDGDSQEEMDLWNEAWDLAKENEFRL
jgi:hypothetical protein